MAFYLLENDGHNTPAFWKFSNQHAAERFLGIGMKGFEDVIMDFGYFANNQSWVDGNGTLWEQHNEPELHIYDKTEE